MYTTKPHFYKETSRALLKIGAGFLRKSLPALRIQEKKVYFCCENAAYNTPNPEKYVLISYESEV